MKNIKLFEDFEQDNIHNVMTQAKELYPTQYNTIESEMGMDYIIQHIDSSPESTSVNGFMAGILYDFFVKSESGQFSWESRDEDTIGEDMEEFFVFDPEIEGLEFTEEEYEQIYDAGISSMILDGLG